MRYIFGEWTLDTQRAELCGAVGVRRLRRKAFQLLAYLLAHADRVVSKHELYEQVWPQQFISETTLESTIKAVRQALGDSGRGQRLIQTVYGQGYRFLAAVEARPEAPAGTRGVSPLVSPGSLSTAPQTTHPVTLEPSPPVTAHTVAGGLATDANLEDASFPHCTSASIGEWKPITVLCCALAESPLGALREVEPHYSALQALSILVHEVVQQYGGTLQPVVDDQLLVLFGAPRAQEDHARCAMLAALDVLQALGSSAPETGLTVRMGVHSGLGVVGTLGPAAHGLVAAVGAPTQVAVRLQQQAAPGMLLVSAATYHLVHAEVRGVPWGSLVLEGQQASLQVYAVQEFVQRRAGVPQRAASSRSPFVGRQRELALLHDRLEAVRTGEGHVVSLIGPPGIGKSRLLTEFGQALASDRVTWVLGQCLAYGQSTPYLPVRDLVAQICACAADAPLETRAAAVQRRLAALGGVAEEEAALLCQLLNLPVASQLLERLTPEVRQAHTFALLASLLRHEAQRQPLVLAVENIHWIDPTSAAWLTFLVERLTGMAALLLLTQRPGLQPPWATHAAVTQLALPPLRAEESQAIVAAVPGAVQLPIARCQQLIARGAGNPFFLEELTWHAVEHGLGTTTVPETVHAVLTARLDRLPAAAKALLQMAAVIGPEVPVSLVQAIAALPEDTLQQSLAHLQAAQLLYETRRVPERTYTFKHALTQEVAYGSLLQEQRRVLHARIVEAQETLAGERVAEQIECLTYHALRGEVWAKVLAYGRQAGEKAITRSAYREAAGYFEQALRALRHLPETRGMREQAIDLHLALRTALRPLGEFARILTSLREAEILAAALDDTHRLGQITVALSNHFYWMGAYDDAIAAGQRSRRLAMANRDVVQHALANLRLGIAYWIQGDARRASACLRQSVATLDGPRRYERFGQVLVPAVHARGMLLWCCAELGTFPAYRALGAEGLQIAEVVAHAGSLMYAYACVGWLSLCQGDLPTALPLLEHAVHLCHEADLPAYFPRMAAALGAAYILAGRIEDAVPLLTQALEQGLAMAPMHFETPCSLPLSAAYLLEGRVEEAHALAARVLALACVRRERGTEAHALRLLGEIAAQREPPETRGAETYYSQASALAETLGMRPLQAHCRRGLGILYARLSQWEQARMELGAARDLYQAMDMTFWLPQMEAVLARAEERDGLLFRARSRHRVPPTRGPDLLSRAQAPICP